MGSLPPFDPDSDLHTLADRWDDWVHKFQNFLVASNITNKEAKGSPYSLCRRQSEEASKELNGHG